MQDKKRRSERVEYINPGPESDNYIVDLSKSGACCLSSSPQEKGDMVQVELGNIAVRAKVVYCAERMNSYRVGLQFHNLGFDKKQQLNLLVESYSKGVPVKGKIIEDNNINEE